MRRDDGRLLLLDEDLRQRAGVGPDEQIVVAGIAHRERAPDEPLLRDDPRITQRLLRSHDIIDRIEPVLQLRLFTGKVFDLGAAGGGLFGERLHPGFHLRKNKYSLDEHEQFRDAIVQQILMQLDGIEAQLNGDGTYTEQGELLYIFTIDEGDIVTTQYYIVKDYGFCLIQLTNFSGSETTEQAARDMVDSFVWDTEG